MMRRFDVIVVGSGVAGLTLLERLRKSSLTVALVTKASVSDSTTLWAQGGVAAVLGNDADSLDAHVTDTLNAGAGLCDEEAVDLLITEGPRAVEELIDLGARFDRGDQGDYHLALEGGHSHARVFHAGGAATGVEVQETLVDVLGTANATIFEFHAAEELCVGDQGVEGLVVLDHDGVRHRLRASHVVLATGGAGQLFAVTTNPQEATGDGVALALRAQVPVSDVEFMQFHPTALHVDVAPRPLLSEALRGEGALLRDGRGERFVEELSPRDVVARAMATTMAAQERDHLWLDATGIDRFQENFPSLAIRLRDAGVNPEVDWIPVAPAAHHWAGGVMTDCNGATMLEGLWAIGEVADVGVHGANRLASNSLLEGMVFGRRCAEALLAGQRGPQPSGVLRAMLDPGSGGLEVVRGRPGSRSSHDAHAIDEADLGAWRMRLQATMTTDAGVLRDAEGLSRAMAFTTQLLQDLVQEPMSVQRLELLNLGTCASVLLASAFQREESRGAHSRREFPEQESSWRKRIVHNLGQGVER